MTKPTVWSVVRGALAVLWAAGGYYGEMVHEIPGTGCTPIELMRAGISRWTLTKAMPDSAFGIVAVFLALAIAMYEVMHRLKAKD